MQVSELTIEQRTELNKMTLEIMTMAVMWALDDGNRAKLRNAAQHPNVHTMSAADVIENALGDFHTTVGDVKPSTYWGFLNSLFPRESEIPDNSSMELECGD